MQLKYILFGAGEVGIRAYKVLGSEMIECFADNYKYGTEIYDKQVISFNEMINKSNEFQIMVASDNYTDIFEKQLIDAGVTDYIFFTKRNMGRMNEVLPKYNYLYNTQFMNYTDILLNYQIQDYKRIAIYGVNKYLNYLLLEIAILSDINYVVSIIDPEINENRVFDIPVAGLEDVSSGIDCLIINKKRTECGIRDEIDNENFDVIDIYDIDKFIFYNRHPQLQRFKNIHNGKRAFIIGNGPSLTMEDLNVLYVNNEICFGLNKIHKIFHQTTWRPTYVCMTDARVINACEDRLEEIAKESIVFMADRYCYSKADKKENVQYVHLKSEYFKPNLPGFSDDIVNGVYWGATVTYDLGLQVAAYMGIKEIYLIGIDHNNVGSVIDPGNHFIPDYFEDDEAGIYKNVVADFDAMDLAYEKAERYSREHGFRIYNATRRGKLEVFERVNFDSLFY